MSAVQCERQRPGGERPFAASRSTSLPFSLLTDRKPSPRRARL